MATSEKTSVKLDLILERVHGIGKEIISRHVDDVDKRARFPTEAFDALKKEKLLSSYVPTELGGMGLSMKDLTKICEVLGLYCGSTAMIFAMHQIQVAIVVHHALKFEFFKSFVKELVEKQYVMASATTELGIGGDVRSSICAPVYSGDSLSLEKQAPVISYGEAADVILITCRKNSEAQKNDQLSILFKRDQYTLKKLSEWDTLGFRGTCSNGFVFNGKCNIEQILPVPYAEIHSQTMHPFAHSVWASLWLGIANDAVSRARNFVKGELRKNPNLPPVSGLRLSELDSVLFSMRGGTHQAVEEYQNILDSGKVEGFSNFGFITRTSNLKVTASQLIVEIVSKAMIICGIAGYRNDSKLTLARQLRDAYGAALMVNNDRILGQTANLQLLQRD